MLADWKPGPFISYTWILEFPVLKGGNRTSTRSTGHVALEEDNLMKATLTDFPVAALQAGLGSNPKNIFKDPVEISAHALRLLRLAGRGQHDAGAAWSPLLPVVEAAVEARVRT